MNKKIEAHVNALFQNTQNSSSILDVKEELLSNLNDKYSDLIESGKSEDEAFALVISGIGDINNLIKNLGETIEYQPLEIEKNGQKRSIFISIGIALYVLSITPVILLDKFNNSEIGVVFMLIICAVATGFVVFGNSMGKIKYSKIDNSFVEEYKEKVAADSDRNKLIGALSSSIWSLIVVFYLAISFITHWWHITWIIFLVGACAQQIIVFCLSESEKRKKLWHSLLWTATTIIYFMISFTTGAWAWSWMLFLMAASVEQIINLIILWKKQNNPLVKKG